MAKRRVSVLILIVLQLAGAGCAQLEKLQTYFPGFYELKSLEVSPTLAVMAVGTQRKFTATGVFTDGSRKDYTSLVDWSVTGSNASLVDKGMVQANTLGNAGIEAKFDRFIAAASAVITNATVTSLTVTPANGFVPAGSTQQMTATANFSDSTTLDVTTAASWSSDNPLVATVNAAGLATAQGQGGTTLRAQYTQPPGAPVSGSTLINVPAPALLSIAITPPTVSLGVGATQQLTATATYTDSSTANITSSAVWEINNANISVSAGFVTALSIGSTNLTARVGGVVSPVRIVDVTAPTLQSIAVTSPNSSRARGLTEQFTATATYSNGSTGPAAGAVWSVTTGLGTGSIDTSGLLTSNQTSAIQPYTVTATIGAISGTKTFDVTNPAVLTVTIAPTAASWLSPGATKQFSATANFTDGSTQDVTTTATWQSSTNGASVNTVGLAAALNVGEPVITAQYGGVTSTGATLKIAQVATGYTHTCLAQAAGITCWGDNTYGQAASKVFPNVRQLAVGFGHSCALFNGGVGVSCWGQNNSGQSNVPPLSTPISMIATGSSHTCAVTASGAACWGLNNTGQTNVPAMTGVLQIDGGQYFTCALHSGGISCWGLDSSGSLSPPTLTNPQEISIDSAHGCARHDAGVSCWGANSSGQTNVPAMTNPKQLSTGWGHSCALAADGVHCWGLNGDGQTNVPALVNPTSVAAGGRHTCAIDATGVVCWGADDVGQKTVPPL